MEKIISYDKNCPYCNEGFIEDVTSYDEELGYCTRGNTCDCATTVTLKWVNFTCGGYAYIHKEDDRPYTYGYCYADTYENRSDENTSGRTQYEHRNTNPTHCEICGAGIIK